MKRGGFTLIELLVVMAILVVLITLGSKGIRSARINAKKAQARVEMASIETAVKSYINKYGKMPVEDSLQGESDFSFAPEIITVLTGEDAGLNPAGTVFLEPQSGVGGGIFLDPWGEPYLIVVDSDYDGQVEIRGEAVARNVALMSVGLYELDTDVGENNLIRSWE